MTWARTTDPKYRSKAHRDYRASLVRQLERDGYLTCTADVCVFPTRTITKANGNARDGLHAGHETDGVTYRGPQHRDCNLLDAVSRAAPVKAQPATEVKRWPL